MAIEDPELRRAIKHIHSKLDTIGEQVSEVKERTEGINLEMKVNNEKVAGQINLLEQRCDLNAPVRTDHRTVKQQVGIFGGAGAAGGGVYALANMIGEILKGG